MALNDPISQTMAPQTAALTGQASAPAAPSAPTGLAASAAAPAQAPSYAVPAANPKVETTAGQLNSLLGQDNPLMQRARTLALEQMNQRGLVNSSMAVGAAQGAVMDRLTPIAQQDAQQAYNERQGLITRQFTGSENALDRTQQASLQTGQQVFQADQQSNQNSYAAAQAALDRAQQVALADKSAGAQASLQKSQQDFTAAQTIVQFDQRLKELGYTNELNKANVPQTFSANVMATTLNQVNALMADPDLSAVEPKNADGTPVMMKDPVTGKMVPTPSPKQAAINNVITYANKTMAWADTFYAGNVKPAASTGVASPDSATASAPTQATPRPAIPALPGGQAATPAAPGLIIGGAAASPAAAQPAQSAAVQQAQRDQENLSSMW